MEAELAALSYMKLKACLLQNGFSKQQLDACPGKPSLMHLWRTSQQQPQPTTVDPLATAIDRIRVAVSLDEQTKYSEACVAYVRAIEALNTAVHSGNTGAARPEDIAVKINEYSSRLEVIRHHVWQTANASADRAAALINADSDNSKAEAAELFRAAAAEMAICADADPDADSASRKRAQCDGWIAQAAAAECPAVAAPLCDSSFVQLPDQELMSVAAAESSQSSAASSSDAAVHSRSSPRHSLTLHPHVQPPPMDASMIQAAAEAQRKRDEVNANRLAANTSSSSEGAGKPWRENVGQHTSIANEIRRNLDNYGDSQILDELLQNADDAGARRCAFLLDHRHHGQSKLFCGDGDEGCGDLQSLQGPALLAYDDAVFAHKDFVGLFSFGRGSKKFDPTATGKFGLGFNSTYHLTECPSFVSGEWFVMLDPQKRYFPGLKKAAADGGVKDPGMRTKFTMEDHDALADQFGPFSQPQFGCDMSTGQSFPGTLFRFPLRNEQQAVHTELRPLQQYSTAQVARLLREFGSRAESVLLYLNNVQCAELWEWREGQPAPHCTLKAELHGDDVADRGVMNAWLRIKLDAWTAAHDGVPWNSSPGALQDMLRNLSREERASIPRQTLKLLVRLTSSAGPSDPVKVSEEEWWVRLGAGLGASWDCATKDDRDGPLTLWPGAAVAAPLRCLGCGDTGMAFATLPTRILTGYPVHVNARWALSDNRKALVAGSMSSQAVQVAWNRALISDTLAALWFELLVELTKNPVLSTAQFYSLWPRREQLDPDSWGSVLVPLYSSLAAAKVLRVRCRSGPDWVDASEGLFDNLLQLPGPDAPRVFRLQWMHMLMQEEMFEAVRALSNSRASRRLTHEIELPRRQSLEIEMPSSGSSTRPPPKRIFQKALRRLIGWVKIRGNLPCVLEADQWDRLLSAPIAILEEFQAAADAERRTGAEPSMLAQVRAAAPSDVRNFYKQCSQNLGFSRSALTLAPFDGLSTSVKAVTGLLAFLLSDLDPLDVTHAQELCGLPVVPLLCGDLASLGADASAPFVVNGIPSLLPSNNSFIHPSATSLLTPWCEIPEVASALSIELFSPQCIARFIHQVLPACWKNKLAVEWDLDTPTVSWVNAFWSFVSKSIVGDQMEMDFLAAFESWPLLPVHCNGKPMLVSCSMASSVLRLPMDGALQESKLTNLSGHQQLILAVLARAGTRDFGPAVAQLGAMGFTDQAAATSALMRTGGNVDEAINVMLNGISAAPDSGALTELEIDPPDSARSASSIFNNDANGSGHMQGRLASSVAWCAASNDTNQWYQIDCGSLGKIGGVVTAGRAKDHAQWVSLYTISVSADGQQWEQVNEGRPFSGNTDQTTRVEHRFSRCDRVYTGRYVRICPIEWHGHIAMRVGILKPQDVAVAAEGVYILQEPLAAAVPAWVGVSVFGASGGALRALSGCIRKAGLVMDGLSDQDRIHLLEYWEGCHFAEEVEFDMVREQPLFAQEGGGWTTISSEASAWFMLPEDISQEMLSGVFLKQTDVGIRLYERLGVIKLPRTEYYRRFVFPRISEMSDSQVFSHMKDLELHLGSLRVQDPTFVTELSQLAWIPSAGGERRCVSEVYDPDNPVFHQFFPERLLPAELREQAPFLRLIGLKVDFDREIFIRCAQEVATAVAAPHSEEQSRRLCSKAKSLLGYLVRNYYTFEQEGSGSEEFFQLVSSFPLVAPRAARLIKAGVYEPPSALLPLAEVVAADDFDLVWSQMPAARTSDYIPLTLRKMLGMKVPSIQAAVDHLMFLSHLSPIELVEAGRARSLEYAVEDIYRFLYLNMSVEQHKEQIVKMKGRRCVLLSMTTVDTVTFATADQIFMRLDQDIAPFGWHLSDAHRYLSTHSELLELLGAQQQPSTEILVAWLRELRSVSNGMPLEPDKLDLAMRILDLLCSTSQERDPELDLSTLEIVAADSTGRIRLARELCFNDAPWMSNRVDLSLVHVLHPRIPLKVAVRIGIRSIRHTVKEQLADSFAPQPFSPAPAVLNGWAASLASRQFRAGLQRLWDHEQLTNTAPTDSSQSAEQQLDSLRVRLESLGNMDMLAVAAIQSSFIECATGRDITLNAHGSLAIVDSANRRILLAVQGIPDFMLLAKLALTLNQYLFGGALLNLAPLEKMLQCGADQVDSVLDMLHISANKFGVLDLLGSELNKQEKKRAHPLAAGIVTDGEMVAWRETSAHALKHGRVTNAAADGTFVIEVGPDQQRTLRHDQILQMLSVAQQQQRTLEEAAVVSEVVEAERPVSDSTMHIPPSEPLEPAAAKEQMNAVAKAHGDDPAEYIERVLYQPADPDWKQKEEALLEDLKFANERAVASLEPEPPGVNDVLESTEREEGQLGATIDAVRSAGFEEEAMMLEDVAAQMRSNVGAAAAQAASVVDHLKVMAPQLVSEVDAVAKQLAKVAATEQLGGQVSIGSSGDLKKGYDLVRWGNVEGVAIFHSRTAELGDERVALFTRVIHVLQGICKVFDYNPCYVTLFWQPHSVSRFIQQKLLFNIWPVEEYMKEMNLTIDTVTTHPFVHMYIYGLMIHKLGHFHDIVHGTRHDFYMQELRIEFMMAWLDYLEEQGFNPAQLETGEFGRFLKFSGVRPQNTGANVAKSYVNFIGGSLS